MVSKIPVEKKFRALNQTTAHVWWSLSKKLLCQQLNLLQKRLLLSNFCFRTWYKGEPEWSLPMGCSCGSPAPPSPDPQSRTGEQPSETSVGPALLLFNLMLLFFCFCISHLFSQKKNVSPMLSISSYLSRAGWVSQHCQRYLMSLKQTMQIFSTVFHLFASANQLSSREAEQSCREGASALKRLQRKKP